MGVTDLEQPAPPASAVRTPAKGFRPDIDGLRAVAIVVIVAYHARLAGFGGGFIGVDVFYVVSGYLISRNLLRESHDSGRVHLLQFWGRRIRRLVPALGLTVVATLVASAVILPGIDLGQVAREGASAAVYASNIVFARASQDYFATNVNQSPFLHTWSLGVEEQFYLIWPVLVGVSCWLVRRRRDLLRRVLIAGFAGMLVGSFAFNLVLTDNGSAWAFYSLPTRAWEFAAAGLLAALPIARLVRRIEVRTIAGVAGLGLIVWATVRLSDTVAYPGWWAVIPVSGTLLVIIAGEAGASEPGSATVVTRGLSLEPAQGVGRLSYSWYLWHWPFIVLAVAAVGRDDTPLRTTAALVSLPVAYGAYRLVENPIRFGRLRAAPAGRTFAMGATVTVVALLAAGGLALRASHPATGSMEARISAAAVATRNAVLGACQFRKLSTGGIGYCDGGDPSSSRLVLVVGDSHAQTWWSSMSDTARQMGVHVALFAKPGCPFIDVSVRPARLGAEFTPATCREVRQKGARLISDLRPASVMLVQSDGFFGSLLDVNGAVAGAASKSRIWRTALSNFFDGLTRQGIKPAVILDNPTLPGDPRTCLSLHQSAVRCQYSRAATLATTQQPRAIEAQVLRSRPGVATFAPTKLLCNKTVCPLELWGNLVYTDTNHLTIYATRSMEPELRSLLTSAVR